MLHKRLSRATAYALMGASLFLGVTSGLLLGSYVQYPSLVAYAMLGIGIIFLLVGSISRLRDNELK
jgi:uncharacterized membrane protein YoaK (UPF0700 family)